MLSVIPGHMDPSQALAQLWDTKQAGLIVEKLGGEFCLAWANVLGDARRNQLTEVANASGLVQVYQVQRSDLGQFNLDLVHPHRTPTEYERLLDTSATEYGMLSSTGDAAIVVTRHETLRIQLSGLVLECDGPPRHVFPQPEKQVGDDCPLCPIIAGRQPKIQVAK